MQYDSDRFYSEFADLIRGARTREKLTQKEVAEKLGIAPSYYCMIEKGKKQIGLPLALDICSVLKTDLRLAVLMVEKPKVTAPVVEPPAASEVEPPAPEKKAKKSVLDNLEIEHRPPAKTYTAYLDVDLVEEIERLAKESNRNRSYIINKILRNAVFGE